MVRQITLYQQIFYLLKQYKTAFKTIVLHIEINMKSMTQSKVTHTVEMISDKYLILNKIKSKMRNVIIKMQNYIVQNTA